MKKRIFEGKVMLENGETKIFDNIVEYNEFVNKLIKHNEVFDASTKTYMMAGCEDGQSENKSSENNLSHNDIVELLSDIMEKVSDVQIPGTSDDKQVKEFKNYCNGLGEDFENIIKKSKISDDVDFLKLSKAFNESIDITSDKMENTNNEINRLYDKIEACNTCLKYYDIILTFYKALKNYLKELDNTHKKEILPGKPNDDICTSKCVTEPKEITFDDKNLKDTYSGIMKLIDAIKKEDNEKGINVEDPLGLTDFFKSLGINYKK